jgi:hypothetical protein
MNDRAICTLPAPAKPRSLDPPKPSMAFVWCNLLDAQSRGLTIFWTHDLKPFTDWIVHTKSTF